MSSDYLFTGWHLSVWGLHRTQKEQQLCSADHRQEWPNKHCTGRDFLRSQVGGWASRGHSWVGSLEPPKDREKEIEMGWRGNVVSSPFGLEVDALTLAWFLSLLFSLQLRPAQGLFQQECLWGACDIPGLCVLQGGAEVALLAVWWGLRSLMDLDTPVFTWSSGPDQSHGLWWMTYPFILTSGEMILDNFKLTVFSWSLRETK